MQITKELKNNVTIVRASGDIDLSNSSLLRKEFAKLLKENKSNILVDLSDVAYMDSSGLATLVEAMQNVKKTNGTFKLCGIKNNVKNIFEIARLNEIFPIHNDIPSALEKF